MENAAKKLTTAQRLKQGRPQEVYATPDKGWIWLVVKHYQKPKGEAKIPYARVMCRVLSPIVGYTSGEIGDVYISEITGAALKVYDEKDRAEFDLAKFLEEKAAEIDPYASTWDGRESPLCPPEEEAPQ